MCIRDRGAFHIGNGRAVVGGKDDQGILFLSGFLQCLQHLAHQRVAEVYRMEKIRHVAAVFRHVAHPREGGQIPGVKAGIMGCLLYTSRCV